MTLFGMDADLSSVMPGLVPGIHDFLTRCQDVDGRDFARP
jgi:hypothetical protein